MFIAAYRKAMQNKHEATCLPPLPTQISKEKLDFPSKRFEFPEEENKTLPVMNGGWQLVGTGTALQAGPKHSGIARKQKS